MRLAAGILAVGVTAVAAQPYPGYRPPPPPAYQPPPPRIEHQPGYHSYKLQVHDVCQDKAFELYKYEQRAASDGRISWRERQTIRALERDLRRTCGGWRHRG